jgi:segregation and condensation protein A
MLRGSPRSGRGRRAAVWRVENVRIADGCGRGKLGSACSAWTARRSRSTVRPVGKRATASKRTAEERRAPAPPEPAPAPLPIVPGEPAFEGQYRVELPSFEGPLDLLLHLIQQHEIDILDIPVSFITEKYLAYLKLMRVLSIDVASEYLVMAATLVHIKSKMLLPSVPAGQEDDSILGQDEEDPRAELVRRLLEYQKYKAAAAELGGRGTLGRDVFNRGLADPVPEGPAPFAPMGVFSLLDAFEKVLKRTNVKLDHEVIFDRISITDRIIELTERLSERRSMRFEELLSSTPDGGPLTRFDLVITFLAVLEMARLKLLKVYQSGPLEPIHLEYGGGARPDRDEPSEAAAEAKTTPVAEETSPVVVEEAPPAVVDTTPIVEEATPGVEETTTVVVEEETATAVEEEIPPAVEETTPAVEETTPAVEEAVSLVERIPPPLVEEASASPEAIAPPLAETAPPVEDVADVISTTEDAVSEAQPSAPDELNAGETPERADDLSEEQPSPPDEPDADETPERADDERVSAPSGDTPPDGDRDGT